MWNFNIEKAPKGETVESVIKTKKGDRKKSIHIPAYIWAASECGIVTKSNWLPEDGRWNCFTKEKPPIAWQVFYKPNHPNSCVGE